MNKNMQDVHRFDKSQLIPGSWRLHFSTGALVFNPTIVTREGGYAMCYRVSPPDGSFRGLAACHLDHDFRVVPGSVVPISDLITYARTQGLNERAQSWHADPRYQRLVGKLYLSWNDGGNRPINHQFLMEMAEDGTTPAGPARELVLNGMDRRSVEKNWMMFDLEDQVYAVYSCSPHVTLHLDMSDPEAVQCQPATESDWENPYSEIFGVMRGGAQPVKYKREGGTPSWLSITHSSYKLPQGRRYEMAVYEFAATAPFQVIRSVIQPVELSAAGIDGFEFTPLNKDVFSVVYPCGAIIDGDSLIVSYGINDENLAIGRIPLGVFENALKPVTTKSSQIYSDLVPFRPAPAGLFGNVMTESVPLFWWDTRAKRFDGDLGARRFKTGNFGDIASRDIFERVGHVRTDAPVTKRRKVVSIGSVLHTAMNGDVIWGSGVKGTARKMQPGVKQLDIRAVRGPLTLDFLRELHFDVSKVVEVFDPGCLVKEVFASEIAAFDTATNADMGPFRVVPHYRDDILMRRIYKDLHHCFLTVDCSPQEMVERMLGAEAVYSSSLHGVIFAESLGIPAFWLKSIGGEDGYKFYDYYYGTGRYQVKCFDTLHDAMRSKPMPLPDRRPDAYLATFPHDVLGELASESYGLHAGTELRPVSASAKAISRILGWSPDVGRVGNQGFWMLGHNAGCGIRLFMNEDTGAILTLTLRPFNHTALPSPQEIDVIVAGRQRYRLRWQKGSVEERTIHIPLYRSMMEGQYLRIETEAKHAMSPASLNVGTIEDKLTVCIRSIALSRKVPVVADGATDL